MNNSNFDFSIRIFCKKVADFLLYLYWYRSQKGKPASQMLLSSLSRFVVLVSVCLEFKKPPMQLSTNVLGQWFLTARPCTGTGRRKFFAGSQNIFFPLIFEIFSVIITLF